MNAKDLTTHAAEQVLRFTRAAAWDDLTEERKVQLGFNLGAMVLGLGLSKAEGYDALAQARTGKLTMADLHAHLRRLITQYGGQHGVVVDETRVNRVF